MEFSSKACSAPRLWCHVIDMSGECMLLGSVSSQQTFGVTDIKAFPRYRSRVLDRLCYISQTNQCYSSILFRKEQENPSSRLEGMPIHRREENRVRKSSSAWERKRERARFGSSFYMFFPPPGPALCKLGQPGVLFVLPEVLTKVLGPSFDLPLFYFHGVFPSLSFSHHHFGLRFPILPT